MEKDKLFQVLFSFYFILNKYFHNFCGTQIIQIIMYFTLSHLSANVTLQLQFNNVKGKLF